MRKKLATAAVAGSALFALAPSGAVAKITCENPAGNEPSGQQGKCQGQALENVNPAGHAPPGHNK